MIVIKTAKQIAGIKKSCQLAAQTLKYTSTLIEPGVTTGHIDDLVHQYILDHHAIPAPLNYKGFPKSICTSVNDVVCHGIPSYKVKLKQGDIINIDITTILDGFYGDTSVTFPVGKIPYKTQLFLRRTKKALALAIAAALPGAPVNNIGKTIQSYVEPFGYSPVRQLGGHGVGLEFHEDPFIYHFDTGSNETKLKPGMIFTIEPMINASPSWQIKIDSKDSWTVRTVDGVLSAQFEHTILITPTSHQILTKI